VVTSPHYNSSKKGPAYDEVKQAPGIANCPVGAVLAALAFTPAGSAVIQPMVFEKAGNVLTDLSALPPATLSDPPPGTTISSARYFTVQIAGGSIDASSILTITIPAGHPSLYTGSERSVYLGGHHRKGACRQTRELRKL
jgi:hypothetical protein